MRPSTLRALRRAAELTRRNRFVEGVRVAELAINTSDADESAEIRRWLTDHADDFVRAPEDA
ncbi:hypothetical protein NGB36_21740 [Streptomyces sp. RB6PN25]|uniref:Uncharacterized protein n=1 Tax=Streptomyces humicola TaxID=2953240 RepID=A0ABT1PZR2_9ACTN|nr:hypothetical protein [Streptomyces humicola]MCQ4083156.1 hypothetical protein [Streptomyces humicola]